MQKPRLFSAVWVSVSGKRAFSSSSKVSQRFYEYRTYTVKPKHFNEFIQLTNENIHLRTAHSKLMGYWITEYGGLNEVTHMWQYDNHGHRTAIRAALASDQNWISTYLSKMLNMLDKQDNAVLYPFPWYNVVEKPNLEQGVYEMRRHTVLPSKLEQFSHRFQQGVEDRNKYSQLIGIWYSDFGELNQVYHLWHYRSPDERVKIRENSEQDEMWKETRGNVKGCLATLYMLDNSINSKLFLVRGPCSVIRDCKLFLSSMSSKLLVPTKFSPWK